MSQIGEKLSVRHGGYGRYENYIDVVRYEDYAKLRADNKALLIKRGVFAEAMRLVEYFRVVHGCEDEDLCTGCIAASKLLASQQATQAISLKTGAAIAQTTNQ